MVLRWEGEDVVSGKSISVKWLLGSVAFVAILGLGLSRLTGSGVTIGGVAPGMTADAVHSISCTSMENGIHVVLRDGTAVWFDSTGDRVVRVEGENLMLDGHPIVDPEQSGFTKSYEAWGYRLEGCVRAGTYTRGRVSVSFKQPYQCKTSYTLGPSGVY